MKLKYVVSVLLVVVYLVVFSVQERHSGTTEAVLTPPLPAIIQQVGFGFFKELSSEMLFVKSAVFTGNDLSTETMLDNADSLSLNLDVATTLYPEFVDPYYLCQSALPHLSPEYAATTNNILQRYVESSDKDMVIPFYRGFNYFYYLDESQLASDVFAELAMREGAPSWFGHFAGILAARNGNLYAGLVSLRSMLSIETDEFVQERYRRDIGVFNQAITIQQATERFHKKFGVYPKKLTQLVPQFLKQIPEFKYGFSIKWVPPELRLLKPIKKNSPKHG